jgi:hypothetical protein
MATIDVETILKRHKRAEDRKEDWRDIYTQAYEYCLPMRNLYDYYETRRPGKQKLQNVYDSTAVSATQSFANRMQSSLFPPYRNWCRLEAGTRVPPESKSQVQAGLDFYSEEMFSVMRQSNFDLALGEFLLDLSVGTAVMLVQPGTASEPIRYTPVPAFLVSLEEGPHGTVENVYRKIRMRPELIERQYPAAKLNQELERLKTEKPDDEVALLEATVYDDDRGEYCHHVIHPETKHLLLKSYHATSPWIVARYSKVAGEVYGRGPVLWALPDVKTLNKTKEFLLKNASLSIAPIFTAADDGVLNPETINIQPGAIIPVARNGGPQGPSLTPLQRGGDVQLTQLVMTDLQMAIKKILLDDSLPRDDMSARTALEISERMRDMAQNLGAAFGRLITEMMVPLVRRTLAVMDEIGLIDLPLRVNGLEIKVVPISPLAQAQNMEEINTVVQFVQLAQGMGPEGQLAYRADAVIDYIADKLGVPSSLRTTPEERAQMQAAVMQAAGEAAGVTVSPASAASSPQPQPQAA